MHDECLIYNFSPNHITSFPFLEEFLLAAVPPARQLLNIERARLALILQIRIELRRVDDISVEAGHSDGWAGVQVGRYCAVERLEWGGRVCLNNSNGRRLRGDEPTVRAVYGRMKR